MYNQPLLVCLTLALLPVSFTFSCMNLLPTFIAAAVCHGLKLDSHFYDYVISCTYTLSRLHYVRVQGLLVNTKVETKVKRFKTQGLNVPSCGASVLCGIYHLLCLVISLERGLFSKPVPCVYDGE